VNSINPVITAEEPMNRRSFLQTLGLATIGTMAFPDFLGRAWAAEATKKKTFVYLFMRGGADGLSIVPPVGDPAYYAARPNIAIPRPGASGGAIALSDVFGLHPSLTALEPLFRDHALALVHSCGMPNPTRSHFDAQDYCETGTPGTKSTSDGWLNRALGAQREEHERAFRAVALQPTLPRSLVGPAQAISLNALSDFRIAGGDASAQTFEALYARAVDRALRTTGNEAFEALDQAKTQGLESLPPQNGAQYSRSPLARRLQDVARLVHAGVGLEIAATDCGGWDTHVAQGAQQGQLAARLKDFGDSLAAFAQDLGPKLADVCLVAMTEFGRTVHENGNRGTDHGTAGVMMVLGGGVRGGRVLGRWNGVDEQHLFEGRDLAVSTDFRSVLSEVLEHQRGPLPLGKVFPGFTPSRVGLFG
jgi:uncharacterized protein (DUF1501 family)